MTNYLKFIYNKLFLGQLDDLKFLQAKCLLELARKRELANIQEAEFKVFSQFGDDGIIQYIIRKLNLPRRLQAFIEFGVGDYTESNTRFLLMNNNWSGLVMDGSKANVDYIKLDSFYWKYDLKAISAFVTTENIDGLITRAGFSGDIGLLHIDIDGNDYWIWKNITVIRPIVVVVEYNSIFGYAKAVTIPYKPDFTRTIAHFSNLYWGSSLLAYCELAKIKGYRFIGTNSAGNNAYFIRGDFSKLFNTVSCEKGFTESKYRESRDKNGRLTYAAGKDRLRLIKNLTVIDVQTNKKIKLRELI